MKLYDPQTFDVDGAPFPEHVLNGFCWCQPLVETDAVTGDHLFIHRRSIDSPHIEPALASPDGLLFDETIAASKFGSGNLADGKQTGIRAMSGPHVTPNPDPAVPYRLITEEKLAQIERDAWNEGHDAGRSVAGLLVAAVCGAIVGAMLVLALGAAGARAAAPRTIVQPDAVRSSGASAGAPTVASDFAQIPAPSETLGAAMSSSAGPTAGATTEPPAIAGGLASWYPARGLIAAVPGWHFGDTPYRVRVTGNGHSVIVTVQDFCACPHGRLIDLADDAFSRLAPLSRGVLAVTISDAPSLTPPPTNTEGKP